DSLILYRGFSTFHALIAAWASIYLLLFSDLFDEDSSNDLIVNRSSIISNMFLGFSIGYFLSDLAMVFWHFPALGGLEYVSRESCLMLFILLFCKRVVIGRVILFGGVFPIVEVCMEVSLAYVALGGVWYLAGLFCLVGLSQTPNCRGLARKALPEASQTPSKWFILLISYLCQVLHHGLSMFSISLSLMSSQGQIYILMVLFSESTTPFVNIRWLVNNLKFVKSFFSLVHQHCLTAMTAIPGQEDISVGVLQLAHCTSGAGVDECGMVLEDREGID
ncbi:hypothetical protein Golob_012241, partial [Gossypium lobatum]|nr:hypothetical protein [Gossypium lobatum]